MFLLGKQNAKHRHKCERCKYQNLQATFKALQQFFQCAITLTTVTVTACALGQNDFLRVYVSLDIKYGI